MVGGTTATGDIVIRGGYLREPASTAAAEAYVTITNTGTAADTLLGVSCGAARTTAIYNLPGGGGTPTASPGRTPSLPYQLAAGATVTLAPGAGYVALEQLAGPLRTGDRVSLVLTFRRTGQVLVELPVIGKDAPVPDGARGP